MHGDASPLSSVNESYNFLSKSYNKNPCFFYEIARFAGRMGPFSWSLSIHRTVMGKAYEGFMKSRKNNSSISKAFLSSQTITS
jgi:hypothetical protein